MSVTPQSIAKHTGFYATALTIQKLLSFIYFSYLARSLGVELTGKYSFALSIAAILMVFMDLGLTSLVTREVAKQNENANALINQTLTIKFLLTIVVSLLFCASLPYLRTVLDSVTIELVIIALLISILDTFSLSLFGTIRAHQNLFYESIASLLFQIIVMIIGSVLITIHANVQLVIGALFIGSLCNIVFAYSVLRIKYRFAFVLRYDKALVRRILVLVIPFAIAAVFVKIYAYIDTVMLQFIKGAYAVGIYSVAYKITFAFQFIPLAFVAALYPAFSYYHRNDAERLRLTFSKSLEFLLIASFAITFGIIGIANRVIPHVYTQSFFESVMPLIILIVSLPFLFLNFPVGSLLNACNRQSRQTWHLGITTILNIVMNIVLIPLYGPIGAAIASTVSTIFIFVIGMYVAVQIVPIDTKKIISLTIRLLVISLLMLACIVGVARIAPAWYWAVVPAGIVYIVGLFVTKVVSIKDVQSLKSLVQR